MSLEEKKTTKEKLFMAGVRVFAEQGYKDATVRQICKLAGSSNINSVNYYFGSKADLYKQILDLIFKEYDVRKRLKKSGEKSPEDRLKDFISINCELLYRDDAVESDMTKIFVTEMTNPSPFLKDIADQYNRPRMENNLEMIRDIIGHDKPEQTVRNCLVSIAGQILYYCFSWPLVSQLFRDESKMPVHDRLARHIYQFSMGGLLAVKQEAENE